MSNRRTDDPGVQCMSDEFMPRNVGLQYDKPVHFVTSQWPRMGNCLFTTYRVTTAVLVVVWCGVDFYYEASNYYSDDYGIWFVFATNWSMMAIAFSCIFQAIAAVIHCVRSKRHQEKEFYQRMPKFYMVLWVVQGVAANTAFVVALSYWVFLMGFNTETLSFLKTPMSRTKHTLNISYMLLDLMVTAIPVRIFHVVYTLVMGLIYAIFSAIYFTNDGIGPDGKPYVYYVMDWRNPRVAVVTCILGFVQTLMSQCVLYGVYTFRMWLYRKCIGDTPEDDQVPLESEAESILTEKIGYSKYNALDHVEINTTEPSSTVESPH